MNDCALGHHTQRPIHALTRPMCSPNACAEGNMWSYCEVWSLISSRSKNTAPWILSWLNFSLPPSLPLPISHVAVQGVGECHMHSTDTNLSSSPSTTRMLFKPLISCCLSQAQLTKLEAIFGVKVQTLRMLNTFMSLW